MFGKFLFTSCTPLRNRPAARPIPSSGATIPTSGDASALPYIGRGREREGEKDRTKRERECVCVRERERKKGTRQTDRNTDNRSTDRHSERGPPKAMPSSKL